LINARSIAGSGVMFGSPPWKVLQVLHALRAEQLHRLREVDLLPEVRQQRVVAGDHHVGVQAAGVMPSIRNSTGSVDGVRIASAM
jgi:hypothetical protein